MLRVVTAAALIQQGLAAVFGPLGVVSILRLCGAFTSALILIGLWSPIAAILIAVTETVIAFLLYRQSNDPYPAIILASVASGLAMLGPGAHSVDARLFGRKHIDLGQGKRN